MEELELKKLEAACAEARRALTAIGARDAIVVSRAQWEYVMSELTRLRAECA